MKLSDYVIKFISAQGIDTVFTVTGGGIMHMVDSLGRSESVDYVCNYHEQACAVAAESYARASGLPGVCLVTTGPGSTNALTGVAGAWVDSIPMLVISGQVRRDIIADYDKVRQMGPQEINIEPMARPVTKYFNTVMDPATIAEELEKAYTLAVSGRPGPVWLNLPLDVQGAEVDLPEPVRLPPPAKVPGPDLATLDRLVERLAAARRPVLVLGNGVHHAKAREDALALAEALGMPVLMTIGGMDLLPEDHPLNLGRFGPFGQRAANFVVQTCDLMLTLGTSMSLSTVGFNTDSFSPQSTKIVVNVDAEESAKMLPRPELAITADAGVFARALRAHPGVASLAWDEEWLPACREWKSRYPVVGPERYVDTEHVNSYVLLERLSERLNEGDIILSGNALDAVSLYQAYKAKKNQRAYTNINFGAMGWDLPAAVGAAFARKGQPLVLVTGDGSLQFSVHELLTLAHYQVDIKLFVLNNGGYESIRATQNNLFAGHLVGADKATGVANPDFAHLAAAYGFAYQHIVNHSELEAGLDACFARRGPVLCEVNIAYNQIRSPRLLSRKQPDGSLLSPALEDMYPFLPAEEVAAVMSRFAR